MKIVTIIGARPQFIKAASLSRFIQNNNGEVEEIIIHTGQHFDANMSEVFFEELNIPLPKYNLNINSLTHGSMTGRMIEEIEKILLIETPDWVVVYGDTNSTLAGALAAKKLHIKVAHIEAGLRSFNMRMPEEINRILTDRISDVLFCPTEKAMQNLRDEGFEGFAIKMYNVGDIMYDSALFFKKMLPASDELTIKKYLLVTIHRAENTDDRVRLTKIFAELDLINEQIPVVLPLHPRTKNLLEKYEIETLIKIIEPVGYLEMISLIENSFAVITDSGGLQKEAYFFKKRCFVLRDETEWIELIQSGHNLLLNLENDNISKIVLQRIFDNIEFDEHIYGNGKTSEKILEILLSEHLN